MPPLNSWHRVFIGSMQEVSAAMGWFQSIAGDLALPESKSFDMQVCLEELMSNIVLHGQSGTFSVSPSTAPPIPLSISLTVDTHGDAVVMIVEDNGRPFDITQAPPKVIDQPLDEIALGGLGVGLVKSFATDLQYQRTEMGNRVTLRFAV